MKLLGIEMPLEEFDALIVAQNNGKELKVIDDKVVAIDHILTQQECNEQHICDIKQRLTELSQDFIQAYMGAQFSDLDQRKAEFKQLHNELRILLNKTPRKYN